MTGARYAALGVLDEQRSELERLSTVAFDGATHRAIDDRPRGRGRSSTPEAVLTFSPPSTAVPAGILAAPRTSSCSGRLRRRCQRGRAQPQRRGGIVFAPRSLPPSAAAGRASSIA
jgi:hypothetical protein